jgi:hypothetical protein
MPWGSSVLALSVVPASWPPSLEASKGSGVETSALSTASIAKSRPGGPSGRLRWLIAFTFAVSAHPAQRRVLIDEHNTHRFYGALADAKSLAAFEESPALGSFCQNPGIDCKSIILQPQVGNTIAGASRPAINADARRECHRRSPQVFACSCIAFFYPSLLDLISRKSRMARLRRDHARRS